MVFCTYCGSSFTRDEHLERHILTHTGMKPFRCPDCHMSFNRRDLLQRHYTVHGKDPDQQPVESHALFKSAGRTPIACTNCAKTKTKCDKKYPCSRCADRNLECQMRPTRRATKTRAAKQRLEATVAPASESSVSAHSQQTGTEERTSPDLPASHSSASSSSLLPSPDARSTDADAGLALGGAGPAQSVPDAQVPLQLDVGPPGTMPASSLQQPTPASSSFDDYLSATSGPEFLQCLPSAEQQMLALDWSSFRNMALPPDALLSPTSLEFDGLVGALDPSSGCFEMCPPMPVDMSVSITDIDFNDHLGSLSSHPVFDSHDASLPYSADSSVNSPAPSELGAVDSGIDGWPVFRCNPIVASSLCPKTAGRHLENLKQGLRSPETWLKPITSARAGESNLLNVMPLREMTRDMLLASALKGLARACSLHAADAEEARPAALKSGGSEIPEFLVLPPGKILEEFLASYGDGYERYYSLTPRAIVDANELVLETKDNASSLLTLLMLAQGAQAQAAPAHWWLTPGLTEVCRIALYDLVREDIRRASDVTVLQSALLLTSMAAWSGDKWQMDIAIGQNEMYLAMLKHSGLIDLSGSQAAVPNAWTQLEPSWREWLLQEKVSRLVYAWVATDQEMALFHDRMPSFTLAELSVPLPESDDLFRARSAHEWSAHMSKMYERKARQPVWSPRLPGLRELFCSFLGDHSHTLSASITPLHLRLLLQPLQTLVHQHRQILNCFSEGKSPTMENAAHMQLQEVHILLQRWYGLADWYLRARGSACSVIQTSLMMFHLISLNTVTDFGAIERMARGEPYGGRTPIADLEEALFHAGQALRLAKSFARSDEQPCWWAGCIYRASLVLWCDAVMQSRIDRRSYAQAEDRFALDGLTPDQQQIGKYLTKREGTPMLTMLNGSLIGLESESAILTYCVQILGMGTRTRFNEGIAAKVSQLARRRELSHLHCGL